MQGLLYDSSSLIKALKEKKIGLLATLVPVLAGKPSLLGYYAHCPFTPISTVIC